MTVPNLTEGAFEKILSGSQMDSPIVQLLAQKNVSADNVPRIQVLLSDGNASYQFCLMVGPLALRVEAGAFTKFSVIRLLKYDCKETNSDDKRVIIITEADVLTDGAAVGHKLGNPSIVPGFSKEVDSNVRNLVSSNVQIKSAAQFVDAPSFEESQICPVSQITPYVKNWVLRGRVTNKSPVKSWNNVKGAGKFFTFNLADHSGEIKITAFRGECDKYFELVILGKVHILSNAVVKEANKKWSDLEHGYELVMNPNSILKLDADNDSRCPQVKYDFVKIGQLTSVPSNSCVDIVGVCRDSGVLTTLTSKNSGKELKKRDISLVDDSEVEIRLTIWHSEAESFSAETGSVVVVKKARLTDYSGKSLTTIATTALQINPDIPEAQMLRDWFIRSGDKMVPSLLSLEVDSTINEIVFLDTIKKTNIACAANATLISNCMATITQIGKASIYMACPENCRKKLVPLDDGFHKCEKCKKQFVKGDYKIIINFCISDVTNSVWVTAFSEVAEKLIGIKVVDIEKLADDDEKKLGEILDTMLFKKINFRIKSNLDNYNEDKLRCNVLAVSAINTINYANKLLEDINKLITN